MKFDDNEADRLLHVNQSSEIIQQMRRADTESIQFGGRASADRVKLVTKEVLKACNVIRPPLSDLNQLPHARKQAKQDLMLRRRYGTVDAEWSDTEQSQSANQI